MTSSSSLSVYKTALKYICTSAVNAQNNSDLIFFLIVTWPKSYDFVSKIVQSALCNLIYAISDLTRAYNQCPPIIASSISINIEIIMSTFLFYVTKHKKT